MSCDHYVAQSTMIYDERLNFDWALKRIKLIKLTMNSYDKDFIILLSIEKTKREREIEINGRGVRKEDNISFYTETNDDRRWRVFF